MLINLSDYFTMEGKVDTQDISLEFSTFHNGIDQYDIVEKTPLHLQLSYVENGKMNLKGQLSITAALFCDRCLKPLQREIQVLFDREIYTPDKAAEDADTLEDQSFMDGYQLDVDALLQEEICMNWPLKILCKEDCKGLCKVCGQDLNEKECGCDTFVPDPRFAGLADLFK